MSPHDHDARPSTAGTGASDRGDDTVSRRSMLAGAGAALAGAASTAGCIELLPPLGQAVRYEEVELPEAEPPRYRDWVPSPEGQELLDQGLGTVAIPNNDAESVLGVPLNTGAAFIVSQLDYFGVGIENYDLAFQLSGYPNNVTVLEGPVAPDEVRETLLASGYEAAQSLRDYDRYVREDLPRTVAVTDGRILFGRGPERDAAIDLALETARDESPDATNDPTFERVTDRVGLRPFLWIGDRFGGYFDDYAVDRYGTCLDYDEETMYVAFYFVFDGETPSREEIRDQAVSEDFGAEYESVEVVTDGQLRGFEVRLDSAAVQSEFNDVGPIPPQITWGVERSADEITVRHDGGDAVPADRLVVAVGYEDDDRVEADAQFTDSYETVGPGASVTVPTDAIPQNEELTIWYVDDSSEMVVFEASP